VRVLKDFWNFLKQSRYLWKMIRIESKRMKVLLSMEKELGVIGAFIEVFEKEMMEYPNEIKQFALDTFTVMYFDPDFNEQSDKDIQFIPVLKQYCDKYGVDFPN